MGAYAITMRNRFRSITAHEGVVFRGRRDRIEGNTTVPLVSPERAHELVAASGCRTAKVEVADPRVLDGQRSAHAEFRRVAFLDAHPRRDISAGA
jgi:hypothetical protein